MRLSLTSSSKAPNEGIQMTTYTAAQVNAWYDAIDNQPAGTSLDAADLAVFTASLNSGVLTPAQVQTSLETSPFTINTVDVVIREYQAAFGRVPDQAGLAYWVGVVAANPAALATLNTTFANSAEFLGRYGATATTIASPALVTALYVNVLGRQPDATGLAYWSGLKLTAAQLLQSFAQSQEFINDAAAPIIAYQNGEVAGGASLQTTGSLFAGSPLTGQTYTLTTGVDVATANIFNGSLTPYNYDGKGPTLTPGDTLTGLTGLTNNTLAVTDAFGQGTDIIPNGVVLTNIQDVTLTTAGNAGVGIGAAAWSTAPFSGVVTDTVVSSGKGVDYVAAGATTDIVINHNNSTNTTNGRTAVAAGVVTTGGNNVTVTTNGGSVTIGQLGNAASDPAGNVTITSNASGNTNSIAVYGGVGVSVTTTNIADAEAITIGSNSTVTPQLATGAITVNDAGTGSVTVYGGTTVNVTDAGGAIVIGQQYVSATPNTSMFDPSGNVTVAQSGTANGGITVYGGANIAIADTSTGGGTINVGTGNAHDRPAGTVTITDSASGGVNVNGGTTITVTDTNTAGGGVATWGGTNVTVSDAGGGITVTGPTGAVNATESGTGSVNVYGGTSVTINDTDALSTAGITVGDGTTDPTGAVMVTDAGSGPIQVNGGTSVTVSSADGNVSIGQLATGLPSGAISVTETSPITFADFNFNGVPSVTVDGGTSVTVSAQGQSVSIGESFATPTGAVTVTQAAVLTGNGLGQINGSVQVGGGTSVTVNTTGGGVTVDGGFNGTSYATGAINITDTFSGANTASTEAFSILGGTTVNLTTTPTSGAITVGEAPVIVGNVITDALADPSGNVTIVNAETYNGVTTYGTGLTTIHTNGATSVSVTGGTLGGASDIADVQTAVTGGVSHLASVSLTGVTNSGAGININSNAFTSLTINNDTATTNTGTVIVNNGNAHALTLSLSGDSNEPIVSDATATSVTVNASGAVNQTVKLTTAGITGALNINNASSGTLAIDTASTLGGVTGVTVSGTGAVNLGVLATEYATLKSIVSTDTAGVTAELNGIQTSFQGAGHNTITLDGALAPGLTMDGGAGGSNTVILNNVEAAYNPVLNPTGALSAVITNFQTLELANGSTGSYNSTGFKTVEVNGATAAVTFNNVDAGTALVINAKDIGGVSYTLGNSTGSNDSLNATVSNIGTASFQSIVTGAIENVSITSTGPVSNWVDLSDAGLNVLTLAGNTGSFIALADAGTQATLTTINDSSSGSVVLDTSVTGAALATINVTGSGAFTMNAGSGGNALATVNAASSSGTINLLAGLFSASGVTVTGGAGELVATNFNGAQNNSNAVDVFTVGTGGGLIAVGGGNAGGNGTGSETINLAAAASGNATYKALGARDVVSAQEGMLTNNLGLTPVGAHAIVNGFNVTADNSSSDALNFQKFNGFGNASTQLTEYIVGNATNDTLINGTYNVVNGVMTLTSAPLSVSAELADAQALVNSGGARMVAFQNGNATFVVASQDATVGGHTVATDTVYQLNGVTGITGFGDHAAGNTILIGTNAPGTPGVDLSVNGVTVSNLNTVTTIGSNGIAYATLSAGGVTNHAADTTTFDLANYAQVNISGDNGAATGQTFGTVVVNQAGAPTGTAALDVSFTDVGANGTTLDALNVSNDHFLQIDANAFNGATITSLVDATNTLNTVVIDGNQAIAINGVTSASLTTIDASAATGSITLTDALINQTIKLGTGSATLSLDGAGDTITQAATFNSVAGHANGDHASITLSNGNIGAAGAGNSFLANGNHDVISFGNGYDFLTANGVGDQIALASGFGDTLVANGGGDTINVGSSWAGNALTANGAGDIITFGSGSTLSATGAGDVVTFTGSGAITALGANATIHVAAGSTESASIVGDVVGAGLSATPSVTTIVGLTQTEVNSHNYSLTVDSNVNGTIAASGNPQVNTATATSLANALDIAAAQAAASQGGTIQANSGVVDWFQYHGNTYVVEANNTTAASATHTALGANDVVVAITGLVDLTNAGVSAHNLAF